MIDKRQGLLHPVLQSCQQQTPLDRFSKRIINFLKITFNILLIITK